MHLLAPVQPPQLFIALETAAVGFFLVFNSNHGRGLLSRFPLKDFGIGAD